MEYYNWYDFSRVKCDQVNTTELLIGSFIPE